MTVGTGVRHSVCDTVNAIYANTPNLDYLIFEGGTNDADIIKNTEKFGSMNLDDYSGDYDETTFCGALDTLFYRAVSLFPNTKIGFIIAQKMGDWSFTAEGNIRRKYFDQVITACKKWGIPFIDLWEGSPLNPKVTQHYNKTLDGAGNIAAGSFYTDGQHLTAKGYDRITPMIEAWIKTL